MLKRWDYLIHISLEEMKLVWSICLRDSIPSRREHTSFARASTWKLSSLKFSCKVLEMKWSLSYWTLLIKLGSLKFKYKKKSNFPIQPSTCIFIGYVAKECHSLEKEKFQFSIVQLFMAIFVFPLLHCLEIDWRPS